MPPAYLCFQQLVPLWLKVIFYSFAGTWQSDSPDKQNQQDHIGERGGEINNLCWQVNKKDYFVEILFYLQ